MGKRARKTEFSQTTRRIIEQRDNGCIFCQMHYRMEKALWLDLNTFSVMHFIPRSDGGLGIEENGAIGCSYHHSMMDNGKDGYRDEMLELFEEYLKSIYDDWNKKKLKYNKWAIFEDS